MHAIQKYTGTYKAEILTPLGSQVPGSHHVNRPEKDDPPSSEEMP